MLFVAPAQAGNGAPVVMILGDSLSAAYGIPYDSGWVGLLQARLTERGRPHRVVNASISGDTTRGALARLPAALERHRPSVLVIELGGNDGLRGIDAAEMRANLRRMVELGRASGARVLLLGMLLPPNYGKAFVERFHRVYHEVAEEMRVPLHPFFLEGVAEDRMLMQNDGIHPTAEAQPRLLDNVWPVLEPLL